MTVTTLNLSSSKPARNRSNAAGIDLQEIPTNVVNIREARKAQEAAKQELLDYLLWSMKHEMDPHRVYDDPIEVFRAELKQVVGLA